MVTAMYISTTPTGCSIGKPTDMQKNRLTGSMTLKYDITDWLYVQGAVQRDGYNLEFKQIQPTGAAADHKAG